MTKNILNKIPDIQYFRNFGEVGITDFQARWEFAKYEIKKLSMEFWKLLGQSTKKETSFLQTKLKKLETTTVELN